MDGAGTDATGRGNDLTNSGASWVAGLIGQAADLEMTENDYLSRASTADINLGDEDFTIQYWIRAESWNALNSNVVDKLSGTTGYSSYVSAAGVPILYLNSGARATWGAALSTGVWYQVIAWHDAAGNQAGIVVNAGTPVTGAYAGGVTGHAGALNVGRYSGGLANVDGLLDMVAIWKRVLSGAERTQLYNGGVGLDYPFSVKGLPVIEHWHNTMYLR